MTSTTRRWLIRIAGVIILLALLAVGGFVAWAGAPLGPEETAIAALRSDDNVRVQTDPWLTFQPTDVEPTTALILYPGGRVDPRAYAPPARDIADEGHLVVIVPMPLNLAVFAPDRAADVIAAHPEVTAWVIGGHSLGGAMAARYARQRPEAFAGLVLWAAFPASGDDLSDRETLDVLSIYGTRDGLLTREELDASRDLLPPDACWVALEGGNHAQFGAYGSQNRDTPATLSAAEQQARIVDATKTFIDLVAQARDGAGSGARTPLNCSLLGGAQ